MNFLTWTDENLLRQVVYVGLRQDKPASEVRRPVPYPKPVEPSRSAAPKRPRSKRLPGPAENILQLLPNAVVPSREELCAYWETVADDALLHLGRRPLKLVRHVKGTTFYHMGPLPEIPPASTNCILKSAKAALAHALWVQDPAGLLGLAEIGVVEIHPWGATVDAIEHPETLVFDLDPGNGVEWGFVVGPLFGFATCSPRGLDCWPKTTGGKGLHVMAPIERGQMDWDGSRLHAAYCRAPGGG